MLEQGLKIRIDWFYSMTVDEKKKMILKAVVSFNWRKMFRVTSRIWSSSSGIKWKWHDGESFFYCFWKEKQFFWIAVTQNHVFDRVFSFDVPLIPLVIAKTALYSTAFNLWGNELLKDCGLMKALWMVSW